MLLLDFQNIVVLISLAINLILLWIIYNYGRKTLGGKEYAVAILAIVGWIFPMALYRSHLFGEVIIWTRLLYIMASFTSTTFLIFTFVFPYGKKSAWWVQMLLFIENILIILLCLHPFWMIRGIELVEVGEDRILWGPLYFIYASHIILLFLAGFIILFLKWRKATGMVRQQILYILVGYFLGANFAMATNLILPWFGYFELNWLGQFFSTLVAIFTTYAIFRYKLLNIKLLATEICVLILNLILLIHFILSDSVSVFFVNGAILLSVFAISYSLLKSAYNEIRRREEVAELARSLEKSNTLLQDLDRQRMELLSMAARQLDKLDIAETVDQNKRLIRLSSAFIKSAQLEKGEITFSFAEININDLISEALAESAEAIKSKKLSVEWQKKENLPSAYVDKEKIKQTILKVLDNAIKYNNPGGAIIINTRREDDGIAVWIQDQGVGFAQSDWEDLYEKFYRGASATHYNIIGTGLSLYMCRQFIEGHGGRVWAQSRGLGKGSEFGFWIPLKKK